jgi:hypothetical protein
MTYPGEKRVVFLFCFALIALAIVGEVNKRDRAINTGDLIEQAPLIPLPSISIEIRGAVEKEGVYHLPKGSTVKEALDLAMLKPEADLSKIKMEKPLLRKQTLRIPYAW